MLNSLQPQTFIRITISNCYLVFCRLLSLKASSEERRELLIRRPPQDHLLPPKLSSLVPLHSLKAVLEGAVHLTTSSQQWPSPGLPASNRRPPPSKASPGTEWIPSPPPAPSLHLLRWAAPGRLQLQAMTASPPAVSAQLNSQRSRRPVPRLQRCSSQTREHLHQVEKVSSCSSTWRWWERGDLTSSLCRLPLRFQGIYLLWFFQNTTIWFRENVAATLDLPDYTASTPGPGETVFHTSTSHMVHRYRLVINPLLLVNLVFQMWPVWWGPLLSNSSCEAHSGCAQQ